SLDASQRHVRTRYIDYRRHGGSRPETSFLFPQEVSDSVYEGAGPTPPLLARRRTQVTLDNYGNAIVSAQLDDIVEGATLTDRHSTQTSTVRYDNDDDTWLIGQARHIEETSALPIGRSVTRTTELDYYPATALLRRIRLEPQAISVEPDLFLETEYNRDSY